MAAYRGTEKKETSMEQLKAFLEKAKTDSELAAKLDALGGRQGDDSNPCESASSGGESALID